MELHAFPEALVSPQSLGPEPREALLRCLPASQSVLWTCSVVRGEESKWVWISLVSSSPKGSTHSCRSPAWPLACGKNDDSLKSWVAFFFPATTGKQVPASHPAGRVDFDLSCLMSPRKGVICRLLRSKQEPGVLELFELISLEAYLLSNIGKYLKIEFASWCWVL